MPKECRVVEFVLIFVKIDLHDKTTCVLCYSSVSLSTVRFAPRPSTSLNARSSTTHTVMTSTVSAEISRLSSSTVEQVDLSNLRRKLDGISINPSVKRLIYIVTPECRA